MLNPNRTRAEAQALTTPGTNPVGIRLNAAEIGFLFGSEIALSNGQDAAKSLEALDCLGFGRHRVTFAHPTDAGKVIKIARNYYGQEANDAEVQDSAAGDQGIPMAVDFAWPWSAIEVERVAPIGQDHPLFPEHTSSELAQYGLTAAGRVVCYDR